MEGNGRPTTGAMAGKRKIKINIHNTCPAALPIGNVIDTTGKETDLQKLSFQNKIRGRKGYGQKTKNLTC